MIFFRLIRSRIVPIFHPRVLLYIPVSSWNSRRAASFVFSHRLIRHFGSITPPSLCMTQMISLIHLLSRMHIPPAHGSSQKKDAMNFFHCSNNRPFFIDFIWWIIGEKEKNEKNLHNHIFYLYSRHFGHRWGGVAQLVRAPPCHGGGRGFESRRSRQILFVVLRSFVCDHCHSKCHSGISPVTDLIHINPKYIWLLSRYGIKLFGVLAQLARAPRLHRGGQGFDSLRLHHFSNEDR